MPLKVKLEPGRKASFELSGQDIEPRSKRWVDASTSQKRDYYLFLAERLKKEWKGQLLGGVGRNGRRMRRVKRISRALYRQAGETATGPPLVPRREGSRVYRHSTVEPFPRQAPDRVVGFFHAGTGRFVSYHALGISGRGHPVMRGRRVLYWVGIKGAITGIVRNPFPSEATVALAVASARRAWGRKYGGKQGVKLRDFGIVSDANRAQVEQYQDALFQAVKPPPTPNEKDAISVYALNSNALNSLARGDLIPSEAADQIADEVALLREFGVEEGFSSKLFQAIKPAEIVQNLDRVIERSRFPEDVTLYRGIRGSFAERLREGSTFSDPGYQSTSLDRNVASQYASEAFGESAILRIRARKGQRGISIEPGAYITNGQIGDREYVNHEILLPRDSQIRITRIRTENGQRIADAEIVATELDSLDIAPISQPVPEPARKQRRFAPSQARVRHVGDDSDREQTTAALDRILRKPVEDTTLASLAGAPDDAEVDIIAPTNDLVILKTRFANGAGSSTRTIRRDEKDQLVIRNEGFFLNPEAQGRGLGREVFGRQVETSAEQGIVRIETEGSRDDNRNVFGYRVWPRFGYDGPIPRSLKKRLPKNLKNARRLSDLMATKEGRQWWDEFGDSIELTFDPAEGSQSRSVWEDYLNARK